MLTATILPQAYLHLTKDDKYHMALAHLIGKDGYEEYTKHFLELGEDTFLMMDTGLIEGDARPIDELVVKAKMLGADEMILTDVFKVKDETLIASHDAMEYVMHEHPDIRMMAVPQGQDMTEWLECAEEMLTWPIHTLGIPKVLTSLGGRDARVQAVEYLHRNHEEKLGKLDIHFLGCWESPLELKVAENRIRGGHCPKIRGVDSVIPYAYARHGLRISDGPRPEGAIDFLAEDANLEVLKFNIEMWKTEAGEIKMNDKIQRIW